MDSFIAISALVTLQDISAVHDKDQFKSPVLKLIADTRGRGYDSLCLPLTTDKWKNRWTDLCLVPPGGVADRDVAAESRAEAWRANPRFLHDEVTISHLGTVSLCNYPPFAASF